MSDASILFQNNLSYTMPTPSSVTTNRVHKRNYFQNRTYTEGQTMVCSLNTGIDFIDTKNSTLNIRLKVNNPNPGQLFSCGFGSGSACNLIKNIRIYHRSGTVYTNTQRYNLYRKSVDKYIESESWFQTIGTIMGYGLTDFLSNAVPGTSDVTDLLIPLDKVHPFFDPYGGVFLPANMSSGLRIEIDLSTLSEAFVNGTTLPNSPISYEIQDIYFNLCSVTLMDSAQASLNTTAQKSSLEYLYSDVFTSINSSPSNNTRINIDINKSVAFCEKVFAVAQDASRLSNINQDSFIADFKPGSFWYKLGSLNFPQQYIDSFRLAYHQALYMFDKLKVKILPSTVSIEKFNLEDGIYACSLERDTSLALSASPVNASRSLRFELILDSPPGEEQIVSVFMTYVTSSRSTLLSSRIDV